jgi:type I restriction enzyme S subunit
MSVQVESNPYPQKKVEQLVKINYGKGLAAKQRDLNGKLPVFGSNGIIGFHSESITNSPAIIIGRKGSVGEVNFSEISCWPIDTSFYIDEYPDNLDPKWLFYCLSNLQLSIHAQGPKPGIKRELLYNTAIPVPGKIKEQRRIVARIEELTRRAEEARKLQLEAVKKIKNIFQTELENIFLPIETDDWSEYDAREVFDIVKGQVDPREEPYASMPHVAPDVIEIGTGRLIADKIKTAAELELKSGKYLFDTSHVLYSKIRPNLRKVALPDFAGTCSADMYPLLPNLDVVTREFLALILLSPSFTAYAVENSDRNAMPKVNRPTMFGYIVKLSGLPEQREIVARIRGMQDKAEEISRLQLSTDIEMQNFQSALLAKAFRGEL